MMQAPQPCSERTATPRERLALGDADHRRHKPPVFDDVEKHAPAKPRQMQPRWLKAELIDCPMQFVGTVPPDQMTQYLREAPIGYQAAQLCGLCRHPTSTPERFFVRLV